MHGNRWIKQRSDIAVLRSRGAGTRQIIWIYLLEGLVTRRDCARHWTIARLVYGEEHRFCQWIPRVRQSQVDSGRLFHGSDDRGLAAVVLAMLATVIPAVLYARVFDRQLQAAARTSDRKPLWQRWFLDVLLLGNCRLRLVFVQRAADDVVQEQDDDRSTECPAVPVLRAGACDFCDGIVLPTGIPMAAQAIQLARQEVAARAVYLNLTQLSRSSKGYYPLMILLILTLGLGVYNASAARTIDLNSTERTLYKYGTDVVMQTVWEGKTEVINTGGGSGGGNGDGEGNGGGNGGQGGGNGGSGGSGGGGGGQAARQGTDHRSDPD